MIFHYKAIPVGKILMFVGFFITLGTLVILYIVHVNSIAIVSTCLVLIFSFFLGYGLFECNPI